MRKRSRIGGTVAPRSVEGVRRLLVEVERAQATRLVLTPDGLAGLEADPAWPVARRGLEAQGVAIVVLPEAAG